MEMTNCRIKVSQTTHTLQALKAHTQCTRTEEMPQDVFPTARLRGYHLDDIDRKLRKEINKFVSFMTDEFNYKRKFEPLNPSSMKKCQDHLLCTFVNHSKNHFFKIYLIVLQCTFPF